jgi:protein-L-isoaspartate(D-aspartate) O-methyltransferase
MTVQTTEPDFVAARLAMVESQLRPEGVVDPAIVRAMASLPREQFVPEAVRPMAYVDRGLLLGQGRYLSAPTVLGQLLMQMLPEPGERALVIGAGTGYSAAVLAAIGLDVVAVESSPELAAKARELGINVIEAPLAAGDPEGGSYDLILMDGAIEEIPEAIIAQLADGGRLGTALIDRSVPRLAVGRKSGGAFGYLTFGDAGVPALPGFSRPKEFTF